MRFLLALASSGILLTAPLLSTAQPRAASTVTPSSVFPSTYPADHAGVFVQTPDWAEIAGVAPSRTKAKHGIAASLSYGVVPATVVAEYEGAHASIQMKSGQPFFCLCHLLSLPGDRVIVRLHQKKNFRELDGGKMIVYPVVGGSKQADANQSDLTAVSISHPDPHVWLVRPQSDFQRGSTP